MNGICNILLPVSFTGMDRIALHSARQFLLERATPVRMPRVQADRLPVLFLSLGGAALLLQEDPVRPPGLPDEGR